LVLDWAKPLAVDTKVKSHVLADFIKLVLRVDRCQCIISLTRRHVGQVTLADLERIGLAEVDLPALKQHGLAGEQINAVKVIKTGEIKRAVTLKGLTASAGAKAAIEAAGGKVLEHV